MHLCLCTIGTSMHCDIKRRLIATSYTASKHILIAFEFFWSKDTFNTHCLIIRLSLISRQVKLSESNSIPFFLSSILVGGWKVQAAFVIALCSSLSFLGCYQLHLVSIGRHRFPKLCHLMEGGVTSSGQNLCTLSRRWTYPDTKSLVFTNQHSKD